MIDKERITRQFVKLVSIDAPSYREREMADYLTKELEELGFSVEEDDAWKVYDGNCGNLYAHRPGSGSPLLLGMHMDTVEPAKGKKAVVYPDGRITSGGTTVLGADDMSGVAAVLEALHHLKEENRPTRELEILLSIGEEKHVKGAKVFDFSKIQAEKSIVLDMSGEIGTAAVQAPSQAFHFAARSQTPVHFLPDLQSLPHLLSVSPRLLRRTWLLPCQKRLHIFVLLFLTSAITG